MSIKVKYFASLREQVGISERELSLSDRMTVSDVWAVASEGRVLPQNALMAVNMEYATRDTPVKDGDEVAFFPPVTGG